MADPVITRGLVLEDGTDRLELSTEDPNHVLVVRVSKISGSGAGRYVVLDADQVEALCDFAGSERYRWLKDHPPEQPG